MRVALNAYLLGTGSSYRSAGVSTYTREILRHLSSAGPEHEWFAFQPDGSPVFPGIHAFRARVPVQRSPVRIVAEQAALPAVLASTSFDVFHGLVNVLPFASRVPSVVTVHDLSFLRMPERFYRSRAAYLRWAVPASARKAERIIAVSEHTASDVVELLGVRPERVVVVPSGVASIFRPLPAEDRAAWRTSHTGNRPYLLYVGTLEPRKNVALLVRAFAAVRKRMGVPHMLVLAGAPGWMFEDIERAVDECGVRESVNLVGFVPEGDLAHWYNAADLFAYPSAYEGFGLPVLEAMACGVPTVTSASSALRELADGAALTVEPGSQAALENAIERVLTDSDFAGALRAAGLRRARQYSWEATARRTVEVYEEARAA